MLCSDTDGVQKLETKNFQFPKIGYAFKQISGDLSSCLQGRWEIMGSMGDGNKSTTFLKKCTVNCT